MKDYTKTFNFKVNDAKAEPRYAQTLQYLLETVLGSVSEGVALFDVDGALIVHNAIFEDYLHPFELSLEPGVTAAQLLDACSIAPNDRVFPIVVRPPTPQRRVIELRRNTTSDGGFCLTCIDITEQTRNEEVVKKLSARHRQILSSAGDGIVGLDNEGFVMFANRAAEKLLSHKSGELVGINFFNQVMHTGRDGLALAIAANPVAKAIASSTELRNSDQVFWGHNGRSFPVQLVVSPLIEDGVSTGAVIVFKDVADEKYFADELKLAKVRADNAQRIMTDALEAIGDGFALWDEKSRLVSCNSQFKKFHGDFAKEITVGLSLQNYLRKSLEYNVFVSPEEKSTWVDLQITLHHQDGSEEEIELNDHRWVKVRNRRTSDGGVVTLMSEITAVKERQVNLETMNRRFRTILEHSPDAILVHNGVTFLFANDAARRLLKARTLTQVIGSPVMNIVPDAYHEEVAKRVQSLLSGKIKRTPYVELELKNLLGERFPAELAGTRVRFQGENCVQVVMRDISQRKEVESQLRILQQAVEQTPANVVITDTKGTILYVNPAFHKTTGYSAKEAIGANPRILKSGQMSHQEYEEMWACLSRGDTWEGELLNRRKDGSLMWQFAIITPIKNDAGEITHFIALEEDITEKKEATEALQNQLVFLSTLIDTIPNPIFYKDANGQYLGYNDAFEKAFGLEGNSGIGKRWNDVHPGARADSVEEHERKLLNDGGQIVMEERVKFVDNKVHDVVVSKSVYLDAHGRAAGIVGVLSDITDRKTLERDLRQMATTDSLTGAANRREFIAAAMRERTRQERHHRSSALVLLDIDHFKAVNDTYGHGVGDIVLKQFVHWAEKMLRGPDVLGRIGGEEFAILLAETDLASAMEVSERLRKSVMDNKITLEDGQEISITVSAGVVSWHHPGETFEQALHRADNALYRAKNAGRNRIEVDHSNSSA